MSNTGGSYVVESFVIVALVVWSSFLFVMFAIISMRERELVALL